MCSNQLLDQSSQLESSSCGQLFKATYFVKTILSLMVLYTKIYGLSLEEQRIKMYA